MRCVGWTDIHRHSKKLAAKQAMNQMKKNLKDLFPNIRIDDN